MIAPLLSLALLAAAPKPASSPEPVSRAFHVEEQYVVPAQSAPIEVWLPVPTDDRWQTITGLKVEGAPFSLVHDERYGNTAARFSLPASGGTVRLSFDAVRHERSADLSHATGKPAPDGYSLWLEPDRLVPLDDRVKKIAAEVTQGQTTPLAKARAIYTHTLKTLHYAKKGKGWGTGSFAWACDAKYGNCTDFHAYVIGLMRAVGIPARFQIGLSVPAKLGEVEGYHCWMDFYLDGVGWVPLDASEAWKDKTKRGYFFGHHDANRIAFSTGRDLRFPGMKGEPLNYFVFAYAESEGKPVGGLQKTVTTRPVDTLTER
jgi:transglutaminase-like putative cysteine protease